MDKFPNTLPPQFIRRAATAQFIVQLESYFSRHLYFQDVVGPLAKSHFASLPVPPEHLDRDTVDECRAIASMLALAQENKCESCVGEVGPLELTNEEQTQSPGTQTRTPRTSKVLCC